MKTTATADDGDLHHQGSVPDALPLDHDEEAEVPAGGGGGGGPRELDMVQIEEGADWLLELLDLPLDPHGDDDDDDDDDDDTTSSSTITAETCIAGDEMMLLTEVADLDGWLLQAQDLAADPRGDDDASTTSTAVEMWADGSRCEMQVDKGDDGEWLLLFEDWVGLPHGDDAATATNAESRASGDDHWQAGAGDCGPAGDLPLDWWVPEPTGPADQLAQGGGVLPDLEAALLLDLIWGTYKY